MTSSKGVATTKDWIEATEAAGMTLTAYNPSGVSLPSGSSYATMTSTVGRAEHAEVRSGRRSLRGKAREEMSEFDRNYSW